MSLKQHAAHTNGNTKVYTTTTTGYTQNAYSEADSYSRAYHGHWGDWYDAWGACTQSCTGHADAYNKQSRYSRYTAYTKESLTSDTNVNTINRSPSLSGATSLNTPNWVNNSLIIDLSSLRYADTENNSRVGYRLYYQYSNTANGPWSTWEIIEADESLVTSKTTASSSYSWYIGNLEQGYYKIAVTVFDGTTWSAILNSNKTEFTNHHRQLLTASETTSGNTRTVVTVSDVTSDETISYIVSSVFSLFKYIPPEWLTNPWQKDTIDQLRNEINTARTTFGLSEYTFSNIPVVTDWTVIRVSDITEARTAFNAVSSAAGKGTPAYTKVVAGNQTDISTNPIEELKNLLDNLSK